MWGSLERALEVSRTALETRKASINLEECPSWSKSDMQKVNVDHQIVRNDILSLKISDAPHAGSYCDVYRNVFILDHRKNLFPELSRDMVFEPGCGRVASHANRQLVKNNGATIDQAATWQKWCYLFWIKIHFIFITNTRNTILGILELQRQRKYLKINHRVLCV